MSTIKNYGLDQYGAVPVEQQQFGTAGVEGVKCSNGSVRLTRRDGRSATVLTSPASIVI